MIRSDERSKFEKIGELVSEERLEKLLRTPYTDDYQHHISMTIAYWAILGYRPVS